MVQSIQPISSSPQPVSSTPVASTPVQVRARRDEDMQVEDDRKAQTQRDTLVQERKDRENSYQQAKSVQQVDTSA